MMQHIIMGISCVHGLITDGDVDIFMLQEHWLTPSNMYKFGDDCPGFICFGSSAMGSAIESGPLYGRP